MITVSRLMEIGRFKDGRIVYRVLPGVPMLGYIAFGVIDRGTNVLQVRPTTICPQNCIFCSVDAGLSSRNRWAEYIVDLEAIVNCVKNVINEKGTGIEVLLDTIGDVLTYPYLIKLIELLRRVNGIRSIALETHGLLLTRKLVDKLARAGLDRINFSIETLNPEKALFLYGTPAYDLRRVIDAIEYAVKETPIDLHVTPLWLPQINDDDLVEIINWAMKIGAGKKWPPITIQKYVRHKYGRNIPLKEVSWSSFWRYIENLERKLGIRLKWDMSEWGMCYMKRVRNVLVKGDVVEVKVIGRGWIRGEYLGVYRDKTLLTITPSRVSIRIGKAYLVEVIHDKDGIYISRVIETVV